uniref:KUP/HAK/KT family potassium transporter n=1 Tax=Paraburkholderia sp. RL17-337-BIB-A TaxID=3031636 RepID=UPI0038BAA19D
MNVFGIVSLIVPISLVILTGLFKIQKRGTGAVGKVFGPVMIVWFVTLAVLGASHIVTHVDIMRAASPLYAIAFVAHAPTTAFFVRQITVPTLVAPYPGARRCEAVATCLAPTRSPCPDRT